MTAPDAPFEIDIDIEGNWPSNADWEAIAGAAANATACVAPELAQPRLSVSLLFADDETVRALNAEWRGKDKPTNVLSFPMLDRADLVALSRDGPPVLLGDVVLSSETCAREAAEKGIALADHAAHLIVHGMLHLAGHDHETGDAEAAAMEALETKALAMMGIADPYGPSD